MDRLRQTDWRSDTVPHLVLGTVQLGMPYGVANISGQPDESQAVSLVQAAYEEGVRLFDTAQAYGQSEQVLGQCLRELGLADRVLVETKFNPDLDPGDGAALTASVNASLERLGVDRLWCMMLHREQWLDRWDGPLGEVFCRAKADGVIKHCGVSVYDLQRAWQVCEMDTVDVVQLACNAWDRTPVESGLLEALNSSGKLCLVRSVFLQGALTFDTQSAARRAPWLQAASQQWNALAEELGLSPAELAVAFASSLDLPLVIGAERAAQVRQTARWMRRPVVDASLNEKLRQRLGDLPQRCVNPSLWPKAPAR